MGHSSIATTMKFYSQVDASQRTKAAAAADSLITNAGKETDAQGQFGVMIAKKAMKRNGDKSL